MAVNQVGISIRADDNTGPGFSAAIARTAAFKAAMDALGMQGQQAGQGVADAAAAADKMAQNAAGAAGAVGFLKRDFQLFGGALGNVPIIGTVTGFHLIADAALEVVGTLGPAAIAFGAFAVAAVPAVQSIYEQMKNVWTVSSATGQALYPLSGGFAKVAAAVRPQVYQLFGDALLILGRRTGTFSQLATSAGTALDQLGARFTFAITHGSGFSGMLAHAGQDLAGWGNLVGNIGGILGTLMKQVPGYAEYLLSFADGLTRIAEVATSVAAPVIHFGMVAHGALLYAGLGGTLAAKAISGSLGFISSMAEKASFKAVAMGGAFEGAAGRLMGFSEAAGTAAGLPWGWISVAAIAVGVLAYQLLTAKDATQKWVASLESMVNGAAAASGLTTILNAQAQVVPKLAQANRQLATAQASVGHHVAATAAALAAARYDTAAAQQNVSDLTGAYKTFGDQAALYQYRVGHLAAIFGSVSGAMGLLTASGIKMNEMLNKGDWPLILQQVTAVSLAYQAMGQRAGILGSDLNALSIAGSQQMSAMTKLNQAWDTVIGTVSGGQSGFITFEQGLQSMATSAKAAGASMTGLNAPSLALRSAWQSSYSNGAKLIDALRMMSSMSPGGFPAITGAVKDVLAQLMPLGKQSQATRAELVAMAQEVKPGITNFRQLAHWIGHTHNAGRALNAILAKDGLNLQNLAADAQKAASMIQNSVTSQFNAAKMAANGTDTAISKLATAIGKGGATAAQIHGDQVQLYNDLRKDGMAAQQAADLVSTLSGRLFKIPKQVHTTITVNGLAWALQGTQQLTSNITWLSAHGGFSSSSGGSGGGSHGGGGHPGPKSTPLGHKAGSLAAPGGVRVPQASSAQGAKATAAAQSQAAPQVHLHVHPGGTAVDQMMLTWLRETIRVHGGTGPDSVQRALGRAA